MLRGRSSIDILEVMNKLTKSVLVLVGLFGLAFVLLRNDVEAPEAVEVIPESVQFTVTPISHASFVASLDEQLIFNDPVGDSSQYTTFGEPAIVLVSDVHGDHLNVETLQAVVGEVATLVIPQAVVDELPAGLAARATVLANNEEIVVSDIKITAIPMYNLPEGEDTFHTKGRGNGYLLEKNGTRVYIAGDTADIPEMRALTDIDYAFVPMNLPYTMTVEAAASAVSEFQPNVVYPYHYRGTEGLSDVVAFKQMVETMADQVEVRLLDWYPESQIVAE